MKYEEWLELPNEEQDRIKDAVWDAYERDNIAIPFMALARMIARSHTKILDGAIGTYHGGEYILHVYVSASDLESCPKPLGQRFEGFRVYWMAAEER